MSTLMQYLGAYLGDKLTNLEANSSGGGSVVSNYQPGVLYIRTDTSTGFVYLEWAKDFDWSSGYVYINVITLGTNATVTSEGLVQAKIGSSSMLEEHDDHWSYKFWNSNHINKINYADIVLVYCTNSNNVTYVAYIHCSNTGYE